MIYAENDNVVWVYKSNKWLVDIERSGGTPIHDPQEPQIPDYIMNKLTSNENYYIDDDHRVYKEKMIKVDMTEFI